MGVSSRKRSRTEAGTSPLVYRHAHRGAGGSWWGGAGTFSRSWWKGRVPPEQEQVGVEWGGGAGWQAGGNNLRGVA